MDSGGHLLSIGKFASLTGISANTLRRYDRLGLLSPAVIDPLTSYRLYEVEQLDAGILIRLLRDLDVPLGDIGRLLHSRTSGDLEDILIEHRDRIAERHAELERILSRLDAAVDAGRGLMPYEIALATVEPVWVVSRRTTIGRADLDEELDRLLGELEEELARAGDGATGREVVLYHNALYWYQGLDMEVCLPVEPATAASHGGRELPGGLSMRTAHRGPWQDIWQAYSMLLARIAREGFEVRGPVREVYLVDERETDDPERYLTEIVWPVRPRTALHEEDMTAP